MSKRRLQSSVQGAAAFAAAAFPPSPEVTIITKKKASKTAILSMHKAGLLQPCSEDDSIEAIWRIRYTRCGHNNLLVQQTFTWWENNGLNLLGSSFHSTAMNRWCLSWKRGHSYNRIFMQAETQQAGCLSIICSKKRGQQQNQVNREYETAADLLIEGRTMLSASRRQQRRLR